MKLFSKIATLAMSVAVATTMAVGVTCGVALAGDTNDTDATFSVIVDGKKMTEVSKVDAGWSYTDYTAGLVKVPLYTVTVPQGTENATITFAKPRLAYNYNAQDVYNAGAVEDVTKGETEVTVAIDAAGFDYETKKVIPADGNPDFIQVQRTYNADYSDGTLLYAITFKYAESAPVSPAPAATKVTKGGVTYVVDGKIAKVSKVSRSKKSVTIAKTVKINGKTYKVSKIVKNAFKGTKVKTVTVKSTSLTKKGVKGCFAKSKVKTVKLNKKLAKKYAKFFTAKNCGKKSVAIIIVAKVK